MTDSNIDFRPYISPEDQSRADIYALLARLLGAAPDAALLSAIASAPPLATEDVGAPLAQAWGNVIAVASVADAEAMGEEYEKLFIGVGKAPLNLHGSHHLTGFMMEQPLGVVRETLKRLGLQRLSTTITVEDHLAFLLEIMRVLILGVEGLAPQPLSAQAEFFNNHINQWFSKCTQAIVKSLLANMYVPVAKLCEEFLRLEQEQFALGK